ncbi:hypothetical protein FQR65_LT05026 [Abscondita terminalis]|nr:hypothetical protein FQR65_LT05026 [Abscondita terminalis]
MKPKPFIVTIFSVICGVFCDEKIDNFVQHYEDLLSDKIGEDRNFDVGKLQVSDAAYDYIIVGSGSAGSAVTSELVKNPNIKVLLLESGGEPWLISEVPLFASVLQFTPLNWGYVTEKQANFCLGLTDELMNWPKGRALGGSSVINYMIHIRGSAFDYDRWAAQNLPGWSYNEMLPIFKALEDAQISGSDAGYRGSRGPLPARDIPYRTGAIDAFVQAAKEVGHSYIDYNGQSQIGVSYVQGTIKNGRRWSAEKAFIRPIRRKNNLKISLNSHVSKVLIDTDTKAAYGVEYVKNGITYKAYARKEVILSAGAFHSPQILMLSGIGPQNHLTELGIPVIKNLPVGEKLYDHLCFLGLIFTVNQPIVAMFLQALTTIGSWLLFGIGPLTSIGGVEGLVLFKTSVATYPENYPDMELLVLGGHLHTDYELSYKKMFRISDKVYDALWKPLYGKWAFGVLPMLLHPKSFGNLKLRSKDPMDPPKLYGNYLTDPDGHDLRAFLDAIIETKRIFNAPALQRYGATLHNVPVPGCQHLVFDTEPYWECALRHISATLHHQSSTCKMGNNTDPEAVVNEKLQVYGIKDLRVADTSIIPITLSSHTNIPAYAVGKKAAQLILADYVR